MAEFLPGFLLSTLGTGWTVVTMMLILGVGGMLHLGAWMVPVQVGFAAGIAGFVAWVVRNGPVRLRR